MFLVDSSSSALIQCTKSSYLCPSEYYCTRTPPNYVRVCFMNKEAKHRVADLSGFSELDIAMRL